MLTGIEISSARTNGECAWCSEPISIGAQYFKWSGFSGELLESMSMHPECYEAWISGPESFHRGQYKRGCLENQPPKGGGEK